MKEIVYDPPITLAPGAYMGAVYEGRIEWWQGERMVAAYERCADGVYRPAAVPAAGSGIPDAATHGTWGACPPLEDLIDTDEADTSMKKPCWLCGSETPARGCVACGGV